MAKTTVDVNVSQPLLETLKQETITSNTVTDILPSNGYDGMRSVKITTNIPLPNITQISNYSITSNGVQSVPIPNGYDAVDSIDLNVNVAGSNIETDKRYDIRGGGTSGNSYNKEIVPSSGYNAMSSVTVNVNLYSPQFTYYSYKDQSTSSGSYVNVEYLGYTEPLNDNSTTSTQVIARVVYNNNSSYTGIYRVSLANRIQFLTISSNGTYYPYNDSTIIKKVVVDVPSNIPVNYFRVNNNYYSFSYSNFTRSTGAVTVNFPPKSFLMYFSYNYGPVINYAFNNTSTTYNPILNGTLYYKVVTFSSVSNTNLYFCTDNIANSDSVIILTAVHNGNNPSYYQNVWLRTNSFTFPRINL